jgi:hypothetical protein
MASQWYFAAGNERLGPYPLETLKQAAIDGRISLSTLVWTDAFGAQWRQARDVEVLAGLLRAKADPNSASQPRSGAQPKRHPYAAGAPGQGPSPFIYIAAWVVGLIFASIVNSASFFMAAVAVIESNAVAIGAVLMVLGTIFSVCAFLTSFEFIFRQLNMRKVFFAGFWVAAASIAFSIANSIVLIVLDEVARQDIALFSLTNVMPFIFWALVQANLWRMAARGRIFPSNSCPPKQRTGPDGSGVVLAIILSTLGFFVLVFGGLFFSVL